jgi:hypothetical protein
MIFKNSLDNVRKTTDKPKKEAECVTNAAIESTELDKDIKIWAPGFIPASRTWWKI